MAFYDRWLSFDFSDAGAEVGAEFIECRELVFGRHVAVQVAYEADSKSDVVEVITRDMAAIDLPDPPIAHFNFAVAGGVAISNDEVVSESVLHFADITVVEVKNAGISLAGSAVVHNDVFPTSILDFCIVNRFADGWR